MTGVNKTTYTLGIKLESKEDYDKLMNDHSKEQTNMFFLTGLDFKGLFEGYPDDYPCLVEYYLDVNPTDMFMVSQVKDLIESGYKVIINKN